MIGEADDLITGGQYDNDRTNGFWDTMGRNLGLSIGNRYNSYNIRTAELM